MESGSALQVEPSLGCGSSSAAESASRGNFPVAKMRASSRTSRLELQVRGYRGLRHACHTGVANQSLSVPHAPHDLAASGVEAKRGDAKLGLSIGLSPVLCLYALAPVVRELKGLVPFK